MVIPPTICPRSRSLPAKVDEYLLKDEYGSRTAEHGEWLAAKEAEDAAGQRMRQKGLEDALLPVCDVPQKTAESNGLKAGESERQNATD